MELDPGDEPAEARLTALASWEREGFFVPSGASRADDYLGEEFLRAARAGEPVVVRDTDTDPRTDREAYRAVGMRESELLLHALMENLPGGAVFVVDKDLRYVVAKGEAITDAGFKPSKSILDALRAELVSEYEPLYRKALAGEPFEHEHASNGHVYLTRGVPLRTSGGEVYAGAASRLPRA